MTTTTRRKPTKIADVADVEAAAKNWSPGQIDCRSLTGHNFKAHTARQVRYTITVVQKCDQCHNLRARDVNATTGRWLDPNWRYTHVDNYLMPKGKGRVDEAGKSALRMMAISHLAIRKVVDGDA